MMTSLLLSVHEPCHENWDEMTPVEKGAFCKACSKEVIDFTGMADPELAACFIGRQNQPVCGRYRNDQLNRPIELVSPDVIYMDIPLWKKYIAILFICFSSLMVGCNTISSSDTRLDETPPIQPHPPYGTNIANAPEVKIENPSIPDSVMEKVQECNPEEKLMGDMTTVTLGLTVSKEVVIADKFPINLIETLFGPPKK